MKRFENLLYPLLLLLSMSAIIIGCKKTPEDPPQPQQPTTTITSIDPATAPVGSTIAINGTNFNTNPGSNTVSIGGVTATIVSATDSRLVVVVPAGAASGPVSVTAGGQTVQSQTQFTLATLPLKPTSIKQGTLFRNQTWTKDSVYILRGMVYIPENYTLTIQAGTVIKGAGPEQDPEGKSTPGALVIERIGSLIARGTATQPIVFTSSKPAGQRNYGDWGGIVLTGKSQVNRSSSTPYPNGVRGTVQAYGEPFDNSGALQYVRIEYAGALQPSVPGARLSGLTMIGVGINTAIDHVQVSYSGGDGFSWFGGSANAKNLVSFRNSDDDWTADWGYVGNVQFGVALRDAQVADQSGSNGLEVENYEPNATADVAPVIPTNGLPQNAPVFANLSNFAFQTTPPASSTVAGTSTYRSGILLRRNSIISVYNSLFYGYPEGLRIEGTAAGYLVNATSSALDLRGVVLANTGTPIVGAGTITTDQITSYFTSTARGNQIIASSDLASLLLNSNSFTLNSPNFVPQTGSPLLSGAATGGKVGNTFFTPVNYRGAFGTDNWLTGWTNFSPQNTDYDR
ncbi:IPT/TIG domain-containing protein [Spirosoma oryzicola]|uniref:IPT/TIG domain-containing protein n=1 Tax=Spirosoma oryzicola TaxID=2898794 RepID=UPI001E53BE2B|nr:IPT/TIG domain-containing protein [Spirosoma oryzicola]UHG90351.1 IPT/TIG domain-containing protein [Spirosoma oryzicola]